MSFQMKNILFHLPTSFSQLSSFVLAFNQVKDMHIRYWDIFNVEVFGNVFFFFRTFAILLMSRNFLFSRAKKVRFTTQVIAGAVTKHDKIRYKYSLLVLYSVKYYNTYNFTKLLLFIISM